MRVFLGSAGLMQLTGMGCGSSMYLLWHKGRPGRTLDRSKACRKHKTAPKAEKQGNSKGRSARQLRRHLPLSGEHGSAVETKNGQPR